MLVAEFKTADEVNSFTKDVVLSSDNSIQHNGENFIIFYEATKDKYEEVFINKMLDGLNRNLFHERVRLASLDAEVNEFKDKGGKSQVFDDVLKRQKEAKDNIRLFEAKIAGLQEWIKQR